MTRAPGVPLQFSVPPDAAHLRVLRRTVRDRLMQSGVRALTIDLVLLVVDEVVSNAIEHGSSYRARRSPLAIELRLHGIEIEFDFEDPEAPAGLVDELQAALERCRSHLPPPESERGRGLWLVADHLRDLRITRATGGGLHLHGLVSGARG